LSKPREIKEGKRRKVLSSKFGKILGGVLCSKKKIKIRKKGTVTKAE